MEDQVKTIVTNLMELGYECTFCDSNANSFYVTKKIVDQEVKLKCELPPSFPYVFPIIHCIEKLYGIIPHIDSDNTVCVFDKELSEPNFQNPTGLVIESISRAFNIIDRGITKKNTSDFSDEFDAYWANKAKPKAFTFFDPKSNAKILHCIIFNNQYFIGEDEAEIERFLIEFKAATREKLVHDKAVYLHFSTIVDYPLPRTNSDFFRMVKNKSNAFKLYCTYLKGRRYPALIVFSQVINGDYNLQAWKHPVIGHIDGFREGKHALDVAYLHHYKNVDVEKITVTRLDRKRLMNRGGDGSLLPVGQMAIVGCGSIGSYLARGIAELGSDQILLIDNQLLGIENIARHICGYSSINRPKVSEVERLLVKHFPYLECEAIPRDIFDVISEEPEKLLKSKYIFITVAKLSIESKIIEFAHAYNTNVTIIILWVEPYLLGGHALILQSPQNIYNKLYDERGSYLFSVINNGWKYAKREAGCQSTYIPYSALDIQLYISQFLRTFHTNFVTKELHGNYRYEWCGNLEWAKDSGIDVATDWLTQPNYSMKLTRLT